MASNDISDWYRSIPEISRGWFTASVVLPLAGKCGIVSIMKMIFSFHMIVYNFEIWRPFTCLFYYPITPQTGFHYLINLYFLYSYSTRLESGIFDGRPADFLTMLIFNWLCLIVIAIFLGLPLIMDPMIISVLYVWCQINRDVIVQFWFGTQFKAMYLPWILAAFNMILMGGGFVELLGILVGHLYFFLAFKYPSEFRGRTFIFTPEFLKKWFPERRGGAHSFGVPPASRRPRDDDNNDPDAHRWGAGQALG